MATTNAQDELQGGGTEGGDAAQADEGRGPEAPSAQAGAWQRLGGEPGSDLRLFKVRHDRMRHPRSGEVLERLVLETPDWVNVVARTPDGSFVLVRQYRFGAESLTLEVPGGVVDPGEDPQASAERELREETGYTSTAWSYLGSVLPNPAFQDNLCHHFLADGARRTHAQSLDPGEDIEIVRYTADEVKDLVARGQVSHSLTLTALSRVLDLRHDPGQEETT